MSKTIQAPGLGCEANVEFGEKQRRAAAGRVCSARWRRLAGVASLVLAGCGGEPGGAPGGAETLPAGSLPYDAPTPRGAPLPATSPFPSPTALADYQLVGRGRKEPVGEQFLPLQLSEPLVGRWRIAEMAAARVLERGGQGGTDETAQHAPAVGPPQTLKPSDLKPSDLKPSELRLEVRLLPRSLPRWRLVGSSSLNAARDSAWIEFVQSKADQVLKLKIDCQWTNCLELVVTPHFQLSPEAAAVPLTPANRQKAGQFTQFLGQRLTAQLQWLAARGGGGGGQKGGGTAKMVALKKQLEQQLKLVEAARGRLEHLTTLQQTLEQEGRVHVRLVSPTTGEEVPLTPWTPDA